MSTAKCFYRIGAMVLAFVMVMSIAPLITSAKDAQIGASGGVVDPSGYKSTIEVPLRTPESAVQMLLPATLSIIVSKTADSAEQDSLATPSDYDEPDAGTRIEADVKWAAKNGYDANIPGEYIFKTELASQNALEYDVRLPEVTVTVTAQNYEITNEPDAWGGNGGMTFTINAPFADFIRLTLDGQEVGAEHYDKAEGSTVITFKESYLKTLSGKPLIRAEFQQGFAEIWPLGKNPVARASLRSADSVLIEIPATIQVTEGNSDHEFPFVLTELNDDGTIKPGGKEYYKKVIAGVSSISFETDLEFNENYIFKLAEDTSNVPLGWSYDRNVYTIAVEVGADGTATLEHSDENVAFEHSVHATGTEQKVTVETGNQGISETDNLHIEAEGIKCYFHYNASSASPMHYRYFTNDAGQVVIGTAYCIDYFNLNTAGYKYVPSTDWDDFKERFGEKSDEILWLVRNGFTSEVSGDAADPFGDTAHNNLSEVQTLIGMTGQSQTGDDGILSEEEAYCATQFAIWRFTSNAIEWVYTGKDNSTSLSVNQRLIAKEYKDVYDAHLKLIDMASSDAPDNEETITRVSAEVNFNIDSAKYEFAEKLYGPVAVDLDLSSNIEAAEADAEIYLTSDVGKITDSAGADLSVPLSDGDEFYMELDSIHTPNSKLANAEAMVYTKNGIASPIEEMYLLQYALGDWNGAQAVLGKGFAYLDIEAEASLLGGIRPRSDDLRVEFVNSYSKPEEPPYTPPSDPPYNPPYGPPPSTPPSTPPSIPPSTPPDDGDNDDDDPPDSDNHTRFDLHISKTVTGSTADDDLQKLFRFQLVKTGVASPRYGTGPIPLATVLKPNTVFVEGGGISNNRIQLDAQGNPTILLLRHGESATFKGLYAGTYRIVELDSNGYDTTYVIGSGDEAEVTDTGSTQSFSLRENLSVAFENSATEESTEIEGHDNPQTGGGINYNPQTGGDGG